MSITYFSVSLTNNSNSRGNIYVVLTTTSSTVGINDNSKTNSSKNPSSLSRGRRFLVYSKLYIEKYCYQSLEMIGILCGYYIRLSYFATIH